MNTHPSVNVLLAEEFLHSADIVACFQEMVAKLWRKVWGVAGLVMPLVQCGLNKPAILLTIMSKE
jgi:hypothetical protein